MGNAPYVVVYYNADAQLGVLPNNAFFLDCHCALRPSHRRQLRVRAPFAAAAVFADMARLLCWVHSSAAPAVSCRS